MSFKAKRALSVVLIALGVSGCGLLGKKTDLNQLINFNSQDMGCMNTLGDHVKAYYAGTIDAQTWGSTWDCATNNLALFKQYVHASDPRGFTQDDIQEFVSGFLVTNQNVPMALVTALFELKASLFGGSSDVISPAEIDKITAFLGMLKTQTTALLPYMVKRAMEPSPANLLGLSDALLQAGANIGAGLHTAGNPIFSFASAQTLADQLAQFLHVDMPPGLVAWLSAVKVVLTAGATDGIAASDWPRIINTIVAYGGPALAVFSVDSKYLTGPNATGQFYLQLALKIEPSLLQTLDLYGGALPLTSLDSVIDSLPATWLTIDRTAIKGALRPLTNKVLMSQVPNAIDVNAIDLIFDKFETWSQAQTYLATIFQNIDPGNDGVTFDEFNTAATNYRQTVPAAQGPAVDGLISLARQTRPLFMGNDPQMLFTPNMTYSLNDLTTFNWVSMLAQHLIKAYGSVPGAALGTKQDLETLVSDFTGIAFALRALDLTVPGWADARFLEANLFTYASNGDDYIDANEAMYLIAMAYSSGTAGSKLRNGIDAACPSQGLDALGYNWVTADCFNQAYFGNYRNYWDHAPLLVQFYQSLSSSDQQTLQQSMERIARRYGVSEQPVGSNDESGFPTIVQYVEALLQRYDVNNDQKLDRTETNVAYPMFKGPLVELGNLGNDGDWLVHDIFDYVVYYGHAPTTDFAGVVSLIAWVVQDPFTTISADRLKLYEVIGSLVQPAPLPSATPTAQAVRRSYTDIASELGLSLTTGLPPAAIQQQMPVPVASGL